MSNNGVPVSAEWALWGMGPRDIGYHVLKCSAGILVAENFDEVLTRYSPGMLEDLPQVAIGWFSDRGQRSYIAFAIHELERDSYDDRGRNVVSTRCFCVPYAELAAGPVSYRAMYERFRQIGIPDEHRLAIGAELPVLRSAAHGDALAMQVAAMLLTCKPVCILGADEVHFTERLSFVDTVMSLLPYGLRSQLSASTWTSSLFYEHKFRLFFTSAPRQADDCVVVWGQDDRTQAVHSDGENYLSWLAEHAKDPAAQLARLTEPIEFSQAEVAKMLERLQASGRQRRPGEEQLPLARSASKRGVEALLINCADKISGQDPGLLELVISQLLQHRDDQVPASQRQRHLDIIKERELFRTELPVKSSLQTAFYKALLQLAFGTPLTYRDYCQLEDCVGNTPGQQMRRSLLLAINLTEVSDFCVRLLVLQALGGEGLKSLLDDQVYPTTLIAAAADHGLRREHGLLVYEVATHDLLSRTDRLDEQALLADLSRSAYLAPTLRRIRPGEFGYQVNELRRLLKLAYGDGLDRPAIRQILGNVNFAPTAALFTAVLTMAIPEDAELVERAFTENLADEIYFDKTRKQLLDVLDDGDQADAEHDNAHQAPDRPRQTRLFRGRRR